LRGKPERNFTVSKQKRETVLAIEGREKPDFIRFAAGSVEVRGG